MLDQADETHLIDDCSDPLFVGHQVIFARSALLQQDAVDHAPVAASALLELFATCVTTGPAPPQVNYGYAGVAH
jgi:hypothetical protein